MTIIDDIGQGFKSVGKAVEGGAKSVGKAVEGGAKDFGKRFVERVASPTYEQILDPIASGISAGIDEAGDVATDIFEPVEEGAEAVAEATGTKEAFKQIGKGAGMVVRAGGDVALLPAKGVGRIAGEVAHLVDKKQDAKKYQKGVSDAVEFAWNVSPLLGNPISSLGHTVLNVSDTVAGDKHLGQALIDQSDLKDVNDVAGFISSKKGKGRASQKVQHFSDEKRGNVKSAYQLGKVGFG